MATCEEKQAQLKQAEDAWHQLQLTGGVVRTRYGDKEVFYNQSNGNTLLRYVNQLRCEVAACTGSNDYNGRRAIRVIPRDSR